MPNPNKGHYVVQIGTRWLYWKSTENAATALEAATIATRWAPVGTLLTVFNKRNERHYYFLSNGFDTVVRLYHEDIATHVSKARREQERTLFAGEGVVSIVREHMRDIVNGPIIKRQTPSRVKRAYKRKGG